MPSFNRYKHNSPYAVDVYARTDYGEIPASQEATNSCAYSSNRDARVISGEERLENALARIHKHMFVWGEFRGNDAWIPYIDRKVRSAPSQLHMAIERLFKNVAALRPGIDLLRNFANDGVYLSGGCFLSAYFGQPVSDFDFFFKDKKTRLEFMQFVMAHGYEPVSVTKNATTLTKAECVPIQLVYNHYYDLPEFNILAFDWSPAQFTVFHQDAKDPQFPTGRPFGSNDLYRFGGEDPLYGLSFACTVDWAELLRRGVMEFNSENIGSRHSSFFRALKYRQKYGLSVNAYGLDDNQTTISSLLNPENDSVYGIPTPLHSLWTAVNSTGSADVFGSMEDTLGSGYDSTLILHRELKHLMEAHRTSWGKPAVNEICAAIIRLVEVSKQNVFLPLSDSIMEDLGVRNWNKISNSFVGSPSAYALIAHRMHDSSLDTAYMLLTKAVMSMEVAMDEELYRISNKEPGCDCPQNNQLLS